MTLEVQVRVFEVRDMKKGKALEVRLKKALVGVDIPANLIQFPIFSLCFCISPRQDSTGAPKRASTSLLSNSLARSVTGRKDLTLLSAWISSNVHRFHSLFVWHH